MTVGELGRQLDPTGGAGRLSASKSIIYYDVDFNQRVIYMYNCTMYYIVHICIL